MASLSSIVSSPESPTPATTSQSAVSPTSLSASSESSAALSSIPLSTAVSTTDVPSSLPTVPTSTFLQSTMSSSEVATTLTPSTASSLEATSSTVPSSSPSSSTPQPTTTSATPTPSSTTTPPPTTTPSPSPSPSTLSTTEITTTTTTTTTAPESPSFSPTAHTTSTTSSPSPTTPLAIVTTVAPDTTIFITTTNVQGQTFYSAPLIVTTVVAITNPAGSITTITQAIVNPTLASNNSTGDAASFFSNTGAVVGVFTVVGLAAASIVLWILFALRRRYRMRRIEHDSAIQAAVAAAGFNRAPLDDDDDGHTRTAYSRSQFSSEMGQRTSYAFGSTNNFGPPQYDEEHPGFNPYVDYPLQGMRNTAGYIPARTASPPPGAERPTTGTELSSNRDRKSSFGHTPTYSAGSFEPLLSGYVQHSEPPHNPPMPPPRNPKRLIDTAHTADPEPGSAALLGAHDNGSSEAIVDDRLDPAMRKLKRSNSLGTAGLRDEEDYSRPVLTVRNIPDAHSAHSS